MEEEQTLKKKKQQKILDEILVLRFALRMAIGKNT